MVSSWERAITQGGGGALGALTRAAASRPPGGGGGGGGDAVGSVGSSVVDADAGDRGAGVTRTKFDYPTQLPAIAPDVEAAFLRQRRAATRGVEDAAAYRQAGTRMAEARRASAGGEITRQAGRDINETMASAASAGRAFSPAGVFSQRRQVLAGAERQQVMLEEQLAETVQDLNRIFRDAERSAEETYAAIDMQRAIMRSNAALENMRNRQGIDLANWSAGYQ